MAAKIRLLFIKSIFDALTTMPVSKIFTQFLQSEKSGGFVLILATVISLLLANSGIGESYTQFWHLELGGKPIEYWINDGLMAVFFLLIGLELEREIYIGHLSTWRQGSLPAIAAIGGMLVPALLYAFFNHDSPTIDGFGIPMATDIAFALGIMALAGKHVPIGLKVFLTALAVIDDLGAILVIAFFYSEGIQTGWLLSAAGLFACMLLLNRLKYHGLWVYLVLGAGLWYCMLNSGIHATLAGVLVAFAIPFQDGSAPTISYRLQRALHIPVSFFILPLFALANTGIIFTDNWQEGLFSAEAVGIFVGLVVGKPLGVLLFSYLTTLLKVSALPDGVNWKQMAGAGMLAGIGFTMSIFITLLAFQQEGQIVTSTMAILFASVTAAIMGLVWLKRVGRKI